MFVYFLLSEHTSGSKSCPKLGVMVLPDPAKDLNTNAAADGSRIVPPSKVKARVKAKLMFMSKLLPPGGPKKVGLSFDNVLSYRFCNESMVNASPGDIKIQEFYEPV